MQLILKEIAGLIAPCNMVLANNSCIKFFLARVRSLQVLAGRHVYDFHFVIKQRTGAGSIPAGEPSEFFSFLAFVIKTYLPLRIERSPHPHNYITYI